MIGATTLDEFRKYIEKDPALERRFQPVFVGEPSVEDTVAILRGLKERYEVHHGVRIEDAALVAAAVLSHRYISSAPAPRQGHRPDRRGRGRGSASRSTRCPSRSTWSSVASASSRSRRRRSAKETDDQSRGSPRRARGRARHPGGGARRDGRALAEREGRHHRDPRPEGAPRGGAHRRREGRARGRPRGRAAQLRYGTMRELDAEIAEKTQRLDELQSEQHDAEGRGRRGGRRRDRRQVDRHPGEPADGGRDEQARAHGGGAPRARHRSGRRGERGRQRHPPLARRAVRSQPADRLVPLPRADRRRQDRAGAHASPTSSSTTRRRWSGSTCRSTRRSTTCRA